MSDMNQAVNAFTATVNSKDAPPVPTSNPLGRLLHASEPFARKYHAIQKFTQKNGTAFTKFVISLPTDRQAQQAKAELKDFKNELGDRTPSRKEQKKLDKLTRNYEALAKRANLKKRIGSDNLENLTSNPVTHFRQYEMLIGESQGNLDRGKTGKLIGSASEMGHVENQYLDRVGILADVMQDPAFQKLAKNSRLARQMGNMARGIERETEAYCSSSRIWLDPWRSIRRAG